MTQRQETTFCQAILDGKLPEVIPDVKASPQAMTLPAARIPRIRSCHGGSAGRDDRVTS